MSYKVSPPPPYFRGDLEILGQKNWGGGGGEVSKILKLGETLNLGGGGASAFHSNS